MKKIGILIDSTFIIEQSYIKKNNLYVIPLIINFKDTSFKNVGDVDKLTSKIFEKVQKDKEIPKTSQPSTQEFLDVYNDMIKAGYEKILAFHLTKNLSGTYQGSVSAANIIKDENENIDISVYDTLNVGISSIAVKEIITEINKEGDITDDKIQNILNYYSDNCKILLSVDTLEYLSLGGRIKPSVAALGNLFGISPILQIKKGEILEFAKVRTQKKAYQRILDEFEKDITNNENKKFIIACTHVLNEKNSQKMRHLMIKILKKKNVKYEDSTFASLSPVLGIHTGPGAIGISWTMVD